MSGPQPGTPTPWEVDTIQSEGEYGNGPFTHSGFSVTAIYDAQGRVIFDALNSDVIEVHEDYGDEDGFVSAHDATSAANAAAIVHRMNNWDALVAERDALQARVDALVAVVKTADDAINEIFRYYDGGETRGSYDGKPERNQLRKAGYSTRAALSQGNPS